MNANETRELVDALNACTAERLRELRNRLDRPALDLAVPIYNGKLARREDLTLRTERWWKDFTRQLARAKASRKDFQSTPTRTSYVAYRRQSRYLAYCWRNVQLARIASANC